VQNEINSSVPELDPNKYHILSNTAKKKLILIAIPVVFILLPILTFFYYKFAVLRPSPSIKEVRFQIQHGDSLPDIAQSLSEAKVLNSRFLFMVYLLSNNMADSIQAGIYTIPAGATVVDLAEMFQHGVNDTKVTFLEGWRVEEFARLAASKLDKVEYETFVEMAKPYEGYLFPDTYELALDTDEEQLLQILTTTFAKKTKDLILPSHEEELGLTKEQIIVMASLVEREVRLQEDREIVAGIMLKRLKEDMKLDVDATTQYVVAPNRLCNKYECVVTFDTMLDYSWWPHDLTEDELNLNSPYNTRKNKGLPPEPICSPSISAIEAVLKNSKTPYYFYLNDVQGNTHYATTLEEHNINIERYLR